MIDRELKYYDPEKRKWVISLHRLSEKVYEYMWKNRETHKRNIFHDDGTYKYSTLEISLFLGVKRNLISYSIELLNHRGKIEILNKSLGYAGKRVFCIKFKE